MAEQRKDRVYFTINGNKFNAGGEFSVDTYLNEFIRRHAELRGTKYMCLEGGCGACIVHVRTVDPNTHEIINFSVNSCLVAIFSCDGWDITTIEGIGNRRIGYNIIQKRLNHYFGSQCGYCSPGFVMSMYSLVQNTKHHLTEKEIENAFGSNLCRCTGYRPILEAFKSLAINPDSNVINKIKDIEDISNHVCVKSGQSCSESCNGRNEDWCMIDWKHLKNNGLVSKRILLVDGRFWCTVNNVNSIFETLNEYGYDSYMLVAGNTSRGVRPLKFYPKLLIDISRVNELRTYYLDVNLVLGANMMITDAMNLFSNLSDSNDDFWYLKVLYDHLERVAHIPVRNIGTLAGNLVLKHEHPDFQSDIFLLLDCVGATVTLVDRNNSQLELSLPEFLKSKINGRIITQIKLPPLSRHYKLITYKITTREQNAHAEVNSGFLFKFDSTSNIILKATIVYGGINPTFTHAYNTENLLVGLYIFTNEHLQMALNCLRSEILPDVNPPEPTPDFRQKLALSLFYKCILKLCPDKILNPIYKSGSTTPTADRPQVSRSYQEYDTDEKEYPITQPLLKKEGILQCAGEAVYSDDLPTVQNEVFASFVLSTVAKAKIESIDATEALKVNGVIGVLTSADIPGINSFIRSDFLLMFENEEILASDNVSFFNQPVAIVVADTQLLADQATVLVKVNYKKISTDPIVFTIEDAIKAPKRENRLIAYPGIVPIERGANVRRIIKGKFICPRQYHNMMELHTCVVMPVDESLEVYSSSQFMDLTQSAIAQVLKIPENLVVVKTRRCGGGFGCKISRQNLAACATALVARKLNRTCRMSMRLTDIMQATGKRPNVRLDYEVGVDDIGEIQYLDALLYINDGFSRNENENPTATRAFRSCYNPNRWKVDSFGVITDAVPNCAMRGPGSFEAISAIEYIMEHIAAETNRDPLSVRFTNYRKVDNELPEIVPMFLERIDYRKRENDIKKYNSLNRWKKRGIAFGNMAFPSQYIGNYAALVSVYHGDGSVIINIGGIEIGQGIYTRVAQAAANEFRISVDKVAVLPSVNFATPNTFSTASSFTTEFCAHAVIRCCQLINARLVPVRATMPAASWEEVVFQADRIGILLQANYLTTPGDPRIIPYSIYGVAVTEVEIDVLTGRKWIIRADVFEDAGRSINPALDVGQIEGGFVQALSLWIMEDIKYNEHTGEIYTNRTWNYKIIGAKDIPYDFRVYLRRRAPNPVGILGSKAVGEPPSCLAYVVVNALRLAIQASRSDSNYDASGFLDVSVPLTNENVVKAAAVKISEYLLN